MAKKIKYMIRGIRIAKDTRNWAEYTHRREELRQLLRQIRSA
jgi:hypothetical protein